MVSYLDVAGDEDGGAGAPSSSGSADLQKRE